VRHMPATQPKRCSWVNVDHELLREYHDREWGVPAHTDRTHFDLWVDGSSTPEAEVERLIGLGAERVEDWTYPPDADFTVLKAPDGTVFCVID